MTLRIAAVQGPMYDHLYSLFDPDHVEVVIHDDHPTLNKRVADMLSNGERLDLKIENGNPIEIGTATGSFRAFGHELTLSVLGIETVSTVYFAEEDYFDRNVLGRIGWLDRVKLGLIEQEGKLFLSEYK